MKEISIDRLKEVLSYCPDTGAITWKSKMNRRIVVGTLAGSKDKKGYLHLEVSGVRLLGHRVAFAISYGIWPEIVDHINRDPSDNRLSNLRASDKSLNAQNQCLNKTRGKHGRGVSFDKKSQRYLSSIHVHGKTYRLGSFQTADDAHGAYAIAKAEYHKGAIQ